jgi:NADH-quinone oxidoreductase subunit J
MMNQVLFYAASALAVAATLMVILSRDAVYAVICLIMSLFSTALVFYTLGSAFLAFIQVIVYAGAIMVLFLFVVMMLNLKAGPSAPDLDRPSRKVLVVPVILGVLLLVETFACLALHRPVAGSGSQLDLAAIAQALYTRHYLGVELASLVLLIGIIGGMHLGRAASSPDTKEAPLDATR